MNGRWNGDDQDGEGDGLKRYVGSKNRKQGGRKGEGREGGRRWIRFEKWKEGNKGGKEKDFGMEGDDDKKS